MTYEEIMMIKENLEILAEERDPKTGHKFEDSVLGNTFNKKILIDAAIVIDELLRLTSNKTSIDKRKKSVFFISEKDKHKILISKEPIPISTFVYSINEHVHSDKMKKLKAVQITSWLVKQGYLKEIEHTDGKKFKITTDKSEAIGISSEKRMSKSGRNYDVNFYNEAAQHFILDHINEIAGNKIDIV